MKVKELIAKYPNHMVVEKGYPDSIPFSELPKELNSLSGKAYNDALMELDVKGYKVSNKPFTEIDITAALFGGRKRKNKSYAGHLHIYLKGNKR